MRVRIIADSALFVLDHEAVFYSGARDELSLFNTAAAFIWCLLEEGQQPGEIAHAYGEAFGISKAQAARHVGAALRRWFALGYVNTAWRSGVSDVPFQTALAQLLTNARLRREYRDAPHELAVALGVARSDRTSFGHLDPTAIDAVAADVARVCANARSQAAARRSWSVAAGQGSFRSRTPSARQRLRTYRVLSSTVGLRCDAPAVGAGVYATLAHCRATKRHPDVVLDVSCADSGAWHVRSGDRVVRSGRRGDEVVPAVKQLLRELASERHPHLMRVHAGVVALGGACVLLPASAGSGKTTLTAALIRSGGTFFTDELALLERDTLGVRPLPLALTIKHGSVDALRPFYSDIDTLPVYRREDYQRVRYLPPPPESWPRTDCARPVRWIVFPKYVPGVDTALTPIDRPTALRKLLKESQISLDHLDRGQAAALVRWMRSVECYDLTLSALDRAVALVRELVLGSDLTAKSKRALATTQARRTRRNRT